MFLFDLKDKEKNLEEHLTDIRRNLIIAILFFIVIFLVSFYFAPSSYKFLTKPLLDVLKNQDYKLVTLSLTENFFTYINLSLFTSILVFLPIFLLQIYIYIFPILKNHEKKIVFYLFVLLPVLFLLGCSFAYYVSFKVIWAFLTKFSINNNIAMYFSISSYLKMSLKIMILMGLSFELPIFIFILLLLNITDIKSLKKFRRFAVVIFFVIGAIFTPPDPLSQIILASVLIALYEISLILAQYLFKISKNKDGKL